MPKSAKYLLIGSTETYSGKSATVLGLSHQLQQKGLDIAYGKPLGNSLSTSEGTLVEEDVQFITHSLNLSANRIAPTILALDEASMQKRLFGEDTTDYSQTLVEQYLQVPRGDLVVLEGPGDLAEGYLFDLSLLQVADVLDASVLLVSRYSSLISVESLLSAKQRVGDRLIGVVINDIPPAQLETVENFVRPYLEQQGIAVMAMLPKNDLLRSVSVGELVKQLNAEVLCRSDRLDLMVESLAIGAMNVNAAVKYFRKRRNMAVVTGGDRVEIQQAALETSTQCLILTGQLPPPQFILSRAEELEIPILSVDLDTLTTVEIVDRTFGQVRVHEPIKVQCIRQLMAENFDSDRLLSKLGLTPATALP
ncbi:DRTGG [Trichormus variabilis ATCC 29413]|uniref:DRTGG n=2 Tax=Anabaena variabilis TaxID=264691 RepID=Q3MBL6_TRIV2|nr:MULTISPECIES: phosphotransacetylase family protein [Nostocaceae]ABA21620.1 DRTGG [Trichormus variabilis ATCC 29413]MBC1216549.1 phosphotransacetylase family protein [Trichormus variabilis ARAD]MBC1257062.1 phosphotransacetylase family protein [Trichormus variabilis V5]MBC1268728.1 phosphotransacetylase family protein [Trichormus variabilis FSR]MBC1304832.1 phosphotransacetylase family protein [Trichormus variabilis N2B]